LRSPLLRQKPVVRDPNVIVLVVLVWEVEVSKPACGMCLCETVTHSVSVGEVR
jgi:hypothetical protein